MRIHSLPARIFGWLARVSLCLVATAVWAQPADLGLPLGGSQGVLGEGNRVPKFDAGFTAPGPDRSAQLFVVATLPPGVHTYSITQAPGGPRRTTIAIDKSADVPVIGEFKTVGIPQIERDEVAFPGLLLESHTGTVKWVAPIQFAAGVRPETVKLQGNVKMQLCDDNGCAQPNPYPFSATLRPDTRAVAVAVAASERPKETPASPLPDRPAPPSVPAANPFVPTNIAPRADAPAASSAPPPATSPVKPAETAKPGPATGDGEIDWIPFTDAAQLGKMVGPGFKLEEIGENIRKADKEDGGLGGVRSALLPWFSRRPDLERDALRAAGDRSEDSLLCRAGRAQPPQGVHAQRLVFVGLAGGVLRTCITGGPAEPGLGRTLRNGLVYDHLGGRSLRHGVELYGRVGSAAADLSRRRQGRQIGRARGRRGGIVQRRVDHSSGHALQRPVPCPCPGMGHGTISRTDLCRVSFHGARHGESLLANRRLSRAAAVPAQARRVDGYLQDIHGLRAHRYGGLSIYDH